MRKQSTTPQSVWKKYAEIAEKKFGAVPKLIRPVVTTYSAQGVIDNGGFPYFFECNWPGVADWQIFADDFDAVGHVKGAEAIRAALRLFPHGRPQADLQKRRRHIFKSLDGLDGPLGELDAPICGKSALLMRLLARYIKVNEID